jgi:hypothetical protein
LDALKEAVQDREKWHMLVEEWNREHKMWNELGRRQWQTTPRQ